MNAIARLIRFNGQGKYVFGAGGTSPDKATPFTWVGSLYGSDCIGAVCWALGIPRHLSTFPEYGGDIGVDSAMMDAGLLKGDHMRKAYFAPVEKAAVVPGNIICFPSIRAQELWPGQEKDHGFAPSQRVRIGHIGFVAGWEGLADPHELASCPWDHNTASLVTLECCAAWPAVRLGKNRNFLDGTHFTHGGQSWTNSAWGVRFMRYVGPARTVAG
jgi:hypothetical protein